jgi:hypothetical protein
MEELDTYALFLTCPSKFLLVFQYFWKLLNGLHQHVFLDMLFHLSSNMILNLSLIFYIKISKLLE